MKQFILIFTMICSFSTFLTAQNLPAGGQALVSKKYEQYEKPEVCKSCHIDIYQQWTQAMMSQSFIHRWD